MNPIDETIERLQTDLREGTGSNNNDVRTVLSELKRLRAALTTARVDAFNEVIDSLSAVLQSRERSYNEEPDGVFERSDREEMATLRVVIADIKRMRDATVDPSVVQQKQPVSGFLSGTAQKGSEDDDA